MIIYFTGSGNSRDIAHRLSEAIGDTDVVELCGEVLRSRMIKAGQPCRAVVWVFPVYSWGVPPVVVNFMRNAKISGITAARHHMVATCGDDAGLTASQWRRLVRKRGWTPLSASTVIMPNTYTLMKGFDVDPPQLAARKLEDSAARVDRIAAHIRKETPVDDVSRGKYAWFKSKVIYPWFIRFAMSAGPFHATGSCTGCGLCARQCPLGNISMDDTRRPCWGKDCALCLRCYHICPSAAVQYGKATRGKGRYLNRN